MNEQFQRLCELQQENANLKSQLYRQSPYKTKLSGFSFTILPLQHKLGTIKSYLVEDQNGNVVDLAIRILSDNTVQITSNVLMDGLTLILF